MAAEPSTKSLKLYNSFPAEKARIASRSMAARQPSPGDLLPTLRSVSTDDEEDLRFTVAKRRASEETLKMTTPRRRQSGDSTWSASSSVYDTRARMKETRKSDEETNVRRGSHTYQRGTDDGVDALPNRRSTRFPGAFAISPGQRSTNIGLFLDEEDHTTQRINEEEPEADETLVSAELVQFHQSDQALQGSSTSQVPVVAAVEDDTAKRLNRVYRLICLLAIILLITIVVVPTAVVLSGRSNDTIPSLSPTEVVSAVPSTEPSTMSPSEYPTSSPTVVETPQPTTARGFLLGLLGPLYSAEGQGTLNDPTTPQGAALNWLESDNIRIAELPDFRIIQRYVMAVFYYSTGGAGWTKNDGWLTDTNECDWYSRASQFFSVCTLDGRIEHLQVDHNNNLRGTIPSEIGLLSMLRSVQIENQFGLTGTIPTEMGLLTRVEIQFGLGGNSLSGLIPSEIGNLVNAFSLGFGGNDNLFGFIPSELGRLSRLKYISASGTNLSGTLPTELGLLTTMTSLSFASNMHTGPIPTEFGLLTGLARFLDLSGNELRTSIPSELGRLTLLRELRLETNRLDGKIPPELFFMESLRELHLDQNGLTGPIPTTIGSLRDLRIVYMNENELEGQIPSEIGIAGLGGLGLGLINLTGNLLTGTVPKEVAELPVLGSLLLNGNKLVPTPLDEAICNVFDDGRFHRIYMDCTTAEECGCCTHCCSLGECKCVESFQCI